jgi:hypothetical protein
VAYGLLGRWQTPLGWLCVVVFVLTFVPVPFAGP